VPTLIHSHGRPDETASPDSEHLSGFGLISFAWVAGVGYPGPTLDRNCDCLVRVTSWTDAPISWPRYQPIGQRGGCGLLLDDDLARAVRRESATAIMAW